MSKILRTLAKGWNTLLFPFVDFDVSAIVADTPEGDKRLKLLMTRRGKDELGTELGYEWDRVTMRLYGMKNVYQGGDFAFLGKHSPYNISKSGEISLDREKKALDVNISINGRPYKYNGHYLYHEDPAQPAA
jgi:hypothetical protein